MSGRGGRESTTAAAAVVVLFVLGLGAVTNRPPVVAPGTTVHQAVVHGFDLDRLVVAGARAEVVSAPTEPAPLGEEVVIPPPPEVFDAPPAPPPPPPPALRATLPNVRSSGGTWAVIIGVNDYPGVRSDLRSAVNDANDVDQALAGLGVPAQNRLVLRDGQATADQVRASVEWLVSHAGPDAVAVFFYAGHVRKLGETTEAIVGADGNLVTDRELGERLAHLQTTRAWVAIAACYGGGFTEVLAPGRILTGAAGPDSLAYESSAFGRSYMVQYMVREAMIDKRAAGSIQMAFAYASTELAAEHPGRQPVQIDSSSGPLDLRPAFPVATGGPPPKPAPPAPSGTPPSTPPTTTCRQLLILSCG